MINKIKSLVADESGQGMTEYGLVVGIIAVGVIVALVALREQISSLINGIKTKLLNNMPE
jgi:pilus assembly protein Flp/PilA